MDIFNLCIKIIKDAVIASFILALLAADSSLVLASINNSGPESGNETLRTITECVDTDVSNGILQFTSSGYVLGFAEGHILVTSASHMLKTEFIGANPVSPQSVSTGSTDENSAIAAPLNKVSYPALWEGVTLVYEAEEGAIAKSTYYIDSTSTDCAVNNIRLGYNRPVSLDDRGNLVIAFDNGNMVESAPIAWQEINGEKRPVTVSYRFYSGNEVGFSLAGYISGVPVVIDPKISWNTFLGGSSTDICYEIAVDGSGNVYITGYSIPGWGSPVRAYTSGYDASVTKVDSNGNLLWNTFLGGSGTDYGYGITVDGSGNVYVSGSSDVAWGSPVQAYTSGYDSYVAKLDSNGNLIWNTFLGGSGSDSSFAIALDGSGNIYVTGHSTLTWGSPMRSFTNSNDACVSKLDSNGNLIWNTFLGGSGTIEYGYGIAVDGSGNVYMAGYTTAAWGSPVRPFTSVVDGFIVKLDSSGNLIWNTFLGGSGADYCYRIVLDGSGSVYVTGYSTASWGSPLRAFSSGNDAFTAKVNSNGNLIWNTFLGGGGTDYGYRIALDGSGNIYVAGHSTLTWGSPLRAFSSGNDTYAAKLDNSGSLKWNTFLGGGASDYGYGVGTDVIGNVYVAGYSTAAWGSPVRAFGGGYSDLFIAKLIPAPEISVEGNLIMITSGDTTPSTDDYTNFGPADVISGTVVRTFTILDNGELDLSLSGSPPVDISGIDAADFTVTTQPSSPVAARGSTTFQVTFDPGAKGTRTATISITNDDSDENPYSFAIQGQGTIALNVTGITAENKVYDGTTSTTLNTSNATLVGVIGGDDITLNAGSATGVFSDKNTEAGKAVTIYGLTLSGTDAVNYTVNQPVATADITTRELIVAGATANNKVYDGTTSATLNTNNAALVGVVGGDDVILNANLATGNFTDANLGIGKTVIISGLVISGVDSGNYALIQPVTTADITCPEIRVEGNSLEIITGDTVPSTNDYTDFGCADVSAGNAIRIFVIKNTGTSDLHLTGGFLAAIVGNCANDFTVTSQPSSPVAAGGSTAFQVTFDPGAIGTRTATISIANDDSDENPYTFTIQGTGQTAMVEYIIPTTTIPPRPAPAPAPIPATTPVIAFTSEKYSHTIAEINIQKESNATDSKGNGLSVTSDKIILVQQQNTLAINIPVALTDGATLGSFTDSAGVTFKDNHLEIPASSLATGAKALLQTMDEAGDLGMVFILETGACTGTGDMACAEVLSIECIVGPTGKDLSSENPSLGKVASTIKLDMNNLPDGAQMKITTSLKPDAGVRNAFQAAAGEVGMGDISIAFIISVEKTNLKNDADIKSASVIMAAGSKWVDANGGADTIRIIRFDPETGTRQVLETRFLGNDEQERAIFEGISPEGLSLFGLTGLKVDITSTITPPMIPPLSADEYININWQIIGLVAISIVALAIVCLSLVKKS